MMEVLAEEPGFKGAHNFGDAPDVGAAASPAQAKVAEVRCHTLSRGWNRHDSRRSAACALLAPQLGRHGRIGPWHGSTLAEAVVWPIMSDIADPSRDACPSTASCIHSR